MAEQFRCCLCSSTRTRVIPSLQRRGALAPLRGRTICAGCGTFVSWEVPGQDAGPRRTRVPSAGEASWTDSTTMPWGVHKDVPLGKIPPSYFAWLSRQPWISEWPELERYISKRPEKRSQIRMHKNPRDE